MQQLISTITLVLTTFLFIAPASTTQAGAGSPPPNEPNTNKTVSNKITKFTNHVGDYAYLSGRLSKVGGQTVLEMNNYVLALTHVAPSEKGINHPLQVREEDLGKLVVVKGYFTISMLYETSIMLVVNNE